MSLMIASRLSDEPVLLAPNARGRIEGCLVGLERAYADFRARERSESEQYEMQDDFWYDERDWRSALRPYVVKDGVLQIPVKGVLLHDFPYAFFGLATGYEYIWRAYERGMGDANVRGIALVVDSPGGMVSGNFDLVDKMFALRGTKPVRGYASEHAYSAAYSIISVVDPGQLHVARTGGVGSIGVLTAHVDVSKAMDEYGLKITFIFAGKHKVDGNPYEALPDDVKARIQARIDALYDVFVATVARNRAMDEQAVRDTEALTFTAQEALSNGLADKIGALDDSLAEFAADLSEGDETMSEKDKSAADQAAIDTARAEGVEQGKAEGLAQGKTEGAAAERTRINAILGSEEGKARPIAAHAAALDTDMTVEQATAFLAKLPAEEPAAKAPSDDKPHANKAFEDAMDKGQNPDMAASGGQQEEADATSGDSDVAFARKCGLVGYDQPKSQH